MMALGRVGFIGRFKPLHNGGAAALEAICEQAEEVVIGIGSSNKYNVRNPFTAQESQEMIDAFLSPRFSNYSIIHLPDFAHIPEYRDGTRWQENVIKSFGELDCFLTGNPYVRSLLEPYYQTMHPALLVPDEKKVPLKGSMVRVAMAQHIDWQSLVPEEVADYLEKNNLVERFRREFGLQTLAEALKTDYARSDSLKDEQSYTRRC